LTRTDFLVLLIVRWDWRFPSPETNYSRPTPHNGFTVEAFIDGFLLLFFSSLKTEGFVPLGQGKLVA